jgi:MYXO-CTERM domain-containing protein
MTCALAVASAWLVLGARDAQACGGCFHEPTGPTETDGTIVTDHRMVLSISPAQTVLWDQIQYTGNPSSFAWVLPVRPGARIELSDDAWIASLDAATQTVIVGPTPSCGFGGAPTDYEGGEGAGCGASSASPAAAGFGGAEEEDAGESGNNQVQVVSQQTVGPYEAVTVRSSQGEALGAWLNQNGYAVPPSIQPTIDQFTTEGFDFIALKLFPGEGVQAMQPVRIVTPGANPSLPLRMVAAGTGANVGIELFVLSEGRYHPQNFPDVTVDFSQLAWDPTQARSNYAELSTTALATDGGTGWLTESAQALSLYTAGPYNPALATTYQNTCVPRLVSSCPADGGIRPEASTPEGGPVEASAGDGGVVDVAADAQGDAGEDAQVAEAGSGGDDDGGTCAQNGVSCDDLDVAMIGMSADTMWVTRLRSYLPQSALASDLVLEAAPSQVSVPNVHNTSVYTIPGYNPCPASASSGNGNTASASAGGMCACRTAQQATRGRYADVILGAIAAVALAGAVRRRRRA